MKRRKAKTCIGALVVLLSVPVFADVVAHAAPDYDFDGDGKADVTAVRDEGNLRWWIQGSLGAVVNHVFGLSATDFIVPADYDGDGQTDVAVWRPGPVGTFYIKNSNGGAVRIVELGTSGDDPTVVGDWDGDGLADPAVFRPGGPGGQSVFHFVGSDSNPGNDVTSIPWGTGDDFAFPADYDGDGQMDAAIVRNVGGQAQHWILRSLDSGLVVFPFGLWTDTFVPGDYDGDGLADTVAVRDSGGQRVWWQRRSTGGLSVVWFGLTSDDPIAGDYDGDGKSDVAVFRPGPGAPTQAQTWVLRSATPTVTVAPFGQSLDVPAGGAFVR